MFPIGKVPKIVATYLGRKGLLTINDPEVLNEIYVTMNKFIDKHPKTQRVLKSLTGDSILFNPSNELWAQKRKHLSAAFYKDKLNAMLEMII